MRSSALRIAFQAKLLDFPENGSARLHACKSLSVRTMKAYFVYIDVTLVSSLAKPHPQAKY